MRLLKSRAVQDTILWNLCEISSWPTPSPSILSNLFWRARCVRAKSSRAERELAERLEVSRPSLREALEKLSARGLLETSKAGTFVTKFMEPLTEPLAAMMQSNEQALIDYLEYRGLVEGETARLAATRATDVELDAMRECLERMRVAHKVDDPTARPKPTPTCTC